MSNTPMISTPRAAAHTPGPLRFDGCGINDAEGRRLATLSDWQMNSLNGRANAARIVQSWESHDELVAALRAFVALLPSGEGLGGHAPIGAFIIAGHAARAALAKAAA